MGPPRDSPVFEFPFDLTLRDYFAAAALQGFCASDVYCKDPYDDLAKMAYKQANAMLAHRSANPE